MTVVARDEGVRGEHVVVPMPDGFGAPGPPGGRSAAPRPAGAARLSFDNGAARLDLRAGAEPGRLLEGRFTEPLPLVWAVDAKVHVEYPAGARPPHRDRPSGLRLAAGLPWSVDVHGRAERLDADLSGVDLRSLAFHAGLAHARIVLGRPRGRCTVRLASVDDLRISRPPGVPVRFEAAGGTAGISLDGRAPDAAGRGHRDRAPDGGAAPGRYLVLVRGGASGLTVDEAADLGNCCHW